MQWLARVFASAFVRKLGYVAAVAALAVVSQCAHAAGTIPQPVCTALHPLETTVTGGPWCGSAPTGAVAAYAAALTAWATYGYTGGASNVQTFRVAPSPACGATYCYVDKMQSIAPGSWNTFGGSAVSVSLASCPANSTGPTATQCSCNAGFVPNGTATACVPPDPCLPTLAQPMGSPGQAFAVPVASAILPATVCTNSCKFIPRATGPGTGMISKLGTAYTYNGGDASQWIGLGTSCTAAAVGSNGSPSTPPQPYPAPLEPGTCPGTVNGVAVIVPCDSTTTGPATSPAGSASSASGTASSPAGTTGNTSSQASSTTCTGSGCTTTTTTTTNNPNGTTTTTTDTKNEDKGDFCAEHPGNPQCADEEDEQKDPCDDAPDRAACKNLGTLEATPLQNVNVPLAITPSTGYGPSNATCPAPQTATLMGHTYSFSWQPFCDLATGIRPVVLALAWLSAAIGFLGLARKGN